MPDALAVAVAPGDAAVKRRSVAIVGAALVICIIGQEALAGLSYFVQASQWDVATNCQAALKDLELLLAGGLLALLKGG